MSRLITSYLNLIGENFDHTAPRLIKIKKYIFRVRASLAKRNYLLLQFKKDITRLLSNL